MKKRFFLLFALTILCLLSFVFGSVAVFAETTDYSTMWKDTQNVTITKESGIKLAFAGSGAATYQYNFDIEDSDSEIVVSAKDFTATEGTVFTVKLLTSSYGSNVINFLADKKVKLGTDEESVLQIGSFENVKISIKDKEVYVNSSKLGKSNITVGYSGLAITATTNVNVFLKKINHVDFSADTLPKDREFYYDNDCFINRGYDQVTATDYETLDYNAIVGYDYTVDDVAFFGTTFTPSNSGVVYCQGTISGGAITWGEELTYRTDVQTATKVRFPNVGLYKVIIKATNGANEKEDAIVKYYKVAEQPDEDSLSFLPYSGNEAKYKEIANEVITAITDQTEGNEGEMISIGKNFYYPKTLIYDVVVSKYFDAAQLTTNSPVTYTLCYAKGSSSSDFTSVTTSSFELSEMTKYVFFVLPNDDWKNGFTYSTAEFEDYQIKYLDSVSKELKDGEEVEVQIGAWFDQSDNFLIPVFSFEITDNKAPEITVGFENPAFIGQQYKVQSITINASEYTAEYKLYYMTEENYDKYKNNTLEGISNSDKKVFNKDSFISDSAYYNRLIELVGANKITEVKNTTDVKSGEDMEDAFDKTNLTFTPKKGYYYVLCLVEGENGFSDSAVTYAIASLEEPEAVTYESEWWKHNWKSVMYLSISGVSLVGILLLLFVKPSKKSSKNHNDEI